MPARTWLSAKGVGPSRVAHSCPLVTCSAVSVGWSRSCARIGTGWGRAGPAGSVSWRLPIVARIGPDTLEIRAAEGPSTLDGARVHVLHAHAGHGLAGRHGVGRRPSQQGGIEHAEDHRDVGGGPVGTCVRPHLDWIPRRAPLSTELWPDRSIADPAAVTPVCPLCVGGLPPRLAEQSPHLYVEDIEVVGWHLPDCDTRLRRRDDHDGEGPAAVMPNGSG